MAHRSGHDPGCLRCRRWSRHQCPWPGAAPAVRDGPAGHRRQQSGRRRSDRHTRRGRGPTGRPDIALRRCRQHRHQSVGSEGHDRHPHIVPADLPDDGLPLCADGQRPAAGEQRRRAGGARPQGAGQDDLLLDRRRHRHASQLRMVRPGGRHRCHPCALQGHLAGTARHDRRPGRHGLRGAGSGHRLRQGWQTENAGRDGRQDASSRCRTCRRSRSRASTW